MSTQREIFTNILIIAFVITHSILFAASDFSGPQIGVNYGTIADNLPAPADVINLFKKNNIKFVRIYDPNPAILNALKGSLDILVSVGTRNEDITSFAQSPEAATAWVNTNIVPYKDSVNIAIVTVGNEIDLIKPFTIAASVAQAMTNIKSALNAVGLPGVLVSTTAAFTLQTSFPPSAGAFNPEFAKVMKDVTSVLRQNKSPMLVSFYPYYSYVANQKDIPLDYALLAAKTPVIDGQLQYFTLIEAQIDAYYAALAAIGAGDIQLIIAESGWPTAGNDPISSVANAQTHNTNLINRIKTGKGTPRNPNIPLSALIFSTFDENQKPAGIERNWGIFSPNMQAKYPLTF